MLEERPSPSLDRISVFIGVVVLTPVLIRFVNTSPRTIAVEMLGSPIEFELTGNWLTVTMLTALTCMGANAVIRAHPRMSQADPPHAFTYWILPGLTALISALLLALTPTWPLWWAGLFLTGSAIALVVIAEFSAVDPLVVGYARSRLILNVVAYVLAFMSFTIIYGTRGRSLLTAPATSAVGFVLAFELLNTTEVKMRRMLLYALLIALILGEAAWALNYWRLSAVGGGMILLLIFYTAVGIAQQILLERITRRTLVEFAVVATVALALILRLSG